MTKKTASGEKREKIKNQFFPNDDAWTGEKDKGWFRAPRTLPLILELLSSKGLSGSLDLTRVYIELLARHIDGGIVEMTDQDSHAYAAGYFGSRAVRTWQERMKKLEEVGFIKSVKVANQKYKYILLVHPTVAVENLRQQKQLDDTWLNTYRVRQIEVKEDTYEERQSKKELDALAEALGSPTDKNDDDLAF
jgi:hypothetical protein